MVIYIFKFIPIRKESKPHAVYFLATAGCQPNFSSSFNCIPGSVLRLQRLQADANRQAGLAVQVNEQHLLPSRCQRSAQVVGGSGLRHSALLVCDCNDFHCASPLLYKLFHLFMIFNLYILYRVFTLYQTKMEELFGSSIFVFCSATRTTETQPNAPNHPNPHGNNKSPCQKPETGYAIGRRTEFFQCPSL